MADEIVVESSPEAAETDDISSAQPLLNCEQPLMATIASDTSPATNMAANDKAQDGVPVTKGKTKPPRANRGYSPMAMGVNCQIFNPYGYWPAQGPQMPMPPPPHVTMAAGPSWAPPPPVATYTYGGSAPTSGPYAGLVPISHDIIFSLGKIYWLKSETLMKLQGSLYIMTRLYSFIKEAYG